MDTKTFLATAAALLFLSACGGDTSAGGKSGGGGPNAVSGVPDVAQVREKLLHNVNVSADGLARFVEFKETDRKVERMGGAEEWSLKYEGILEFDGPCSYFSKQRAKGDRAPFEAEATFIKDDHGKWISQPMGIYAR